MAERLLLREKSLSLHGATLLGAGQGFGHDGKLHFAHFFELADQPILVTLAVTAEEADRLFQNLSEEEINVFYTKASIEFGMTGK
jgi:PII-like signaling protein